MVSLPGLSIVIAPTFNFPGHRLQRANACGLFHCLYRIVFGLRFLYARFGFGGGGSMIFHSLLVRMNDR
jgi:hypothetical protein